MAELQRGQPARVIATGQIVFVGPVAIVQSRRRYDTFSREEPGSGVHPQRGLYWEEELELIEDEQSTS